MKTKDDAYQVLSELPNILQDFEWWLDGGTLLGFVRDNDFCENDHDDIDISCWVTPELLSRISEFTERFINKGYSLYNHWHWNNKAHELSVIKNGIKVDIFFKERKDDWSWHCLYSGTSPIKWKRNYSVLFDNLKQITIKGKKYNVPEDCDGYLTQLYGNWTQKQHRQTWDCYNNGNAFTTKDWCEK